VFNKVINKVVPPKIEDSDILKLFLFDARFVPSRGVQCLVKVMSGVFKLPESRNMISYNLKRRFDIFENGLVHP
jgi:translation elongation factor EF-4